MMGIRLTDTWGGPDSAEIEMLKLRDTWVEQMPRIEDFELDWDDG